ncbi:MAG: efflux RND transporter periplasmic adaptor subunit [Chlorobi bacterium]|nr:efflux RND transporter periplasmic adaptor subunit [Chlorobiota bacterium]
MNIKQTIILFLITFTLASCKENKPAEKTDHPPVRIQVAKINRMDMSDTIVIFGEVRLRQEARLASQFDGRLTGFTLLTGDKVKEGQRIGVIVPPMREALSQAMSGMDEKERRLVADEINEIPLYSPISGIVLEVMQHNGDVVQKGESIVHLADLDQLDIYGDLPVAYVPQVKQLKVLKVSFPDYPHSPLFLPISAFSGNVDSKKQTINIRLALDNPKHEFRPGMIIQLSFPDKVHKNALVIPRPALLEEEGVYSVYVLNGNKVEKRNVSVGIKHDDFVEIISGLKEGEQVATEKAYSLTDGMEVRVK